MIATLGFPLFLQCRIFHHLMLAMDGQCLICWQRIFIIGYIILCLLIIISGKENPAQGIKHEVVGEEIILMFFYVAYELWIILPVFPACHRILTW